MAEIDVVKKSSRTWLFIVVALVLIAALWFLMTRGSNSRVAAGTEGGQPLTAALPAAILT